MTPASPSPSSPRPSSRTAGTAAGPLRHHAPTGALSERTTSLLERLGPDTDQLQELERGSQALIGGDKLLGTFLQRIEIAVTGCWLWTGRKTYDGYGRFEYNGKRRGAHRLAYMLLHGSVDDSLEVDHLCFNAGCVNPWHLEQVTGAENFMRSHSVARRNMEKTHCKRGHPFDERNTFVQYLPGRRERRQCRECHRQMKREYYRRNREEANAPS